MVSDDPTGCWHGAMVGKDGDGVWERHFQMSFSWVATLNSRWRCIHSPLLEAGAIGVIPVLFFAWDVFSHWRRSRWSSPCLRGWCLSQRLEPWTTWTARPRLFFGVCGGAEYHTKIYQGICHTWLRSSSFLRQLSENPSGFVPESQIEQNFFGVKSFKHLWKVNLDTFTLIYFQHLVHFLGCQQPSLVTNSGKLRWWCCRFWRQILRISGCTGFLCPNERGKTWLEGPSFGMFWVRFQCHPFPVIHRMGRPFHINQTVFWDVSSTRRHPPSPTLGLACSAPSQSKNLAGMQRRHSWDLLGWYTT